MTAFGLAEATEVYLCSEDTGVKRHLVRHALFRTYSRAVSSISRQIADTSGDDYWRPFLQFLRYHRYRLSAAPLPLNHRFPDLAGLFDRMTRITQQCDSVYPGSGASARALVEQYLALEQCVDNPLLEAIRDLVAGDHRDTAIVVRESRSLADTEALFATDQQLRRVELLVPQMLRSPRCYDRLLVIGPAQWFPEFVFTSPRSHILHAIHYDWMSDDWHQRPLLKGAVPARRAIIEPHRSEDMATADELIPESDWAGIIGRVTRRDPSEHDTEEVEARLCALDGDAYVLLDSTTKAMVIDLHGEPEDDDDGDGEPSVVKRVETSAIRPGMFLVLRTKGGGDYIVALADRLMGERARHYRGLQQRWKTGLKAAVARNGMDTVCRDLTRLGAVLGQEWNVRNWMLDRTIRPRHDEDFIAILQLVGMGSETDECLHAADVIDRAHLRAGSRIRRMLIQKMKASDQRALERLGRVDFDLDEAGGGMISALRVQEIHQELLRVPASRIGRLVEADPEA